MTSEKLQRGVHSEQEDSTTQLTSPPVAVQLLSQASLCLTSREQPKGSLCQAPRPSPACPCRPSLQPRASVAGSDHLEQPSPWTLVLRCWRWAVGLTKGQSKHVATICGLDVPSVCVCVGWLCGH